MDRVKLLYNHLKNSEKKALKTYLTAYHTKGQNKSLDLLKLIEKQPDISQEIASKALYDDAKSKAFIMMKARLYEKMTELLPMSVNPEANRRDREHPYYTDLANFRKYMLIATVLMEKRLNILALEFFEKARKLAANCNAPELEVDALVRIRGLDGREIDRFEDISKEIQRSLIQQELDINAMGLVRKWHSLHANRPAGDEQKIAFLEAHIPELEDKIRQTYSPRADYFMQMLKISYYFLTHNYEACKGVVHHSIDILQKNEGMRSPARMSDPWYQLGKLELLFSNWEEAITAFEKARSFHAEDSWAYLNTSIWLLYAHIYRREIDQADSLIAKIEPELESRVFQRSPVINGIFGYLRSCVYFLKGEFHASWMALQEIQELSFDKEGWITGTKLFEIMILIEKNEPEIAGQKLENLRKHLSRHNTDPRMKTIYKLLSAQERQSFCFDEIQGEADLILSLREQDKWDPAGHEVIRFDDWYMSHRK